LKVSRGGGTFIFYPAGQGYHCIAHWEKVNAPGIPQKGVWGISNDWCITCFIHLHSDWGSLVVGKLSPWINLDSDNEIVRKNSEKVS